MGSLTVRYQLSSTYKCTDQTYLFEVELQILTNRETGKVGMDLPFEVEPLEQGLLLIRHEALEFWGGFR